MKHLITCLSIVILSICFIQCNSSKKLSGAFQAKLVATLCGHHIIKIEDPAFYKLGTEWKAFQHVFTVANHCDFVKAGLKEGDAFECRIVEKAVEQNCMVCEAFMETPDLKRNIIVVK